MGATIDEDQNHNGKEEGREQQVRDHVGYGWSDGFNPKTFKYFPPHPEPACNIMDYKPGERPAGMSLNR
jgi:hypothetical protein